MLRVSIIGFCEWAESDEHDLMSARSHLISLMSCIPAVEDLRYASDSEVEYAYREHEGWEKDIRRFGDLSFQYYRVVFDPHDTDSEQEPVMGNLHDDLADIYGDLWHGLQAMNDGDESEALSLWINSYFYHWGQHASSALHAIDTYYRDNYYTIQQKPNKSD